MRKTTIAAAACALIALAGCGTSQAVSHPAAAPSTTKPPASQSVKPAAEPASTGSAGLPTSIHLTTGALSGQTIPVLSPGQSATFKVDSISGGNTVWTTVTWTVGARVVQASSGTLGPAPKGYEYLAFSATIRDDGPYPTNGDPTYQSEMLWVGPNGRVDNTLARVGCGCVGDGEYGLPGSDLELENALLPGQYVTGVIGLEVPVVSQPAAIGIVSPAGDQGAEVVDVIINYESSTAATLEGSS
jgi:hypothetical protein